MNLPFLTAEWRNLIVANYAVDPSLLRKLVPNGTELDDFKGSAFLSLVAFSFNRNKLFGILPTYPAYSFEEINLRFYVRRETRGETRRAVTFIKELVPSRLITSTARALYNEPYETRPTFHDASQFSGETGGGLSYGFIEKGSRLKISAKTTGQLQPLVSGSFEEFILEHYWGYTAQTNGGTVEYRVRHPSWSYWNTQDFQISPDLPAFYGKDFGAVIRKEPHSVFVAEGSPIQVSFPNRFETPKRPV